ncbi:hypothetical protein BZA70DRAFT_281950 [Myxozyma melibiosi]|uniref:Uncharacterized protein n=1 Tax=Myxozyma melibiosi TaxID=54550 RepID=A0ABR1F1L6_9ASCO
MSRNVGGVYRRTDAQKLRGRVISLLVGGLVGLYFGAKLIPYELVIKEAPSSEVGHDGQPFLKFRMENAKPLELKPELREEIHRLEVARLVDEIQAQRVKDGKMPLSEEVLTERARKLADERRRERGEGEVAKEEGRGRGKRLDDETLRKMTDEGTKEWMKKKFGVVEEEE